MKRVVVLLGVLVALSAGAYVLPGGSILRRMMEARQTLHLSSLKAEGSLQFQGAAVKDAAAALGLPADRPELLSDGTLYLRVPGRCRFEARVLEGNTVAVVQNQGRKRVQGGEIPALTEALQQVCSVLAARAGSVAESREGVERHLRGLGIEPRTSSLGRFDGEVVYVLGQREEGKPQFWVYKNGFRPARVLHTDARGAAWDVRFMDYASSIAGEGMPRTLEVWRDGRRALRFTALQADTRTALPDSLF